MKTLNCSTLAKYHQWHCHSVETVSGETAFHLQTQHRWLDNSVLGFFVIPSESHITLTDDGDTLFHFHAQGITFNHRSLNTLREKLNCTHSEIQLNEHGEIIATGSLKNADVLIADYVSALCAIMHHEREIIGLPKHINDLADTVEHHLRLWKPKHILLKNVIVQGISGHEVKFDFEIDNNLIMAIPPNPQAVGAAMRKVGDVLSGSFLNERKMMIVVDDRNHDLFPQQKIDEEIAIISTFVKALPLSNLIRVSEKQARTAIH